MKITDRLLLLKGGYSKEEIAELEKAEIESAELATSEDAGFVTKDDLKASLDALVKELQQDNITTDSISNSDTAARMESNALLNNLIDKEEKE